MCNTSFVLYVQDILKIEAAFTFEALVYNITRCNNLEPLNMNYFIIFDAMYMYTVTGACGIVID